MSSHGLPSVLAHMMGVVRWGTQQRASSLVSFPIKINPIRSGPYSMASFNFNYFHRAPSSDTATLEVRLLYTNLGKHKHSVHNFHEMAHSRAGAQNVQNKLQHHFVSKTMEMLNYQDIRKGHRTLLSSVHLISYLFPKNSECEIVFTEEWRSRHHLKQVITINITSGKSCWYHIFPEMMWSDVYFISVEFFPKFPNPSLSW